MLLKILIGIVVILLAYNRTTKYIVSKKDGHWVPMKRGNMLCTFTHYKFLSDCNEKAHFSTLGETGSAARIVVSHDQGTIGRQKIIQQNHNRLLSFDHDQGVIGRGQKIEVYGTIIQLNHNRQDICTRFKDACPILKYHKIVDMDLYSETYPHEAESILANHYPIGIPFNCTVDYNCKKFRLLNTPPGYELLKHDTNFKSMILGLLIVSLICCLRYPCQNSIYLSFFLIVLYTLRSYHQYMIVSSPNFTFQFFSNGHLIEL